MCSDDSWILWLWNPWSMMMTNDWTSVIVIISINIWYSIHEFPVKSSGSVLL
jgi:hypothetical protein